LGIGELSEGFYSESRVCPTLPLLLLPPSTAIFSSPLYLHYIHIIVFVQHGKKLKPRLILTYLIPLNLLSALIPSPSLLQPHPRLQELFTPFIKAIQSGNIREYDERLEWAQPRLVGCNVYLVVERAREGCLRVLFKKA